MKQIVVMLALCFTLGASLAQEICNNGTDDDNDGFIDCYDKDCSVSTFCKDFFLGEVADCVVKPPAFPQFTMANDFSSPDETTNHLSRIAIGDLNRDGVPEIVTMNRYTDKVFILNGADGSIQKQASSVINIGGTDVTWEPNWEVAIANIDNDNCGEIYFFGHMNPPGDDNSGYYILAYDCNLNYLWHTAERLLDDPINYGLADFNGDGKTELYVKDAVYNAHTGTRFIKSSATSSTEYKRINGGPVAVDMTGDDNLELVIGLAIYTVNLGNGSADNGSLTLFKQHNDYFTRNMYNATSVADYNLDGELDVLASGSTGSHGDNTTVFFWDVSNDVVKTYSDPIAGTFKVAACPEDEGEFYKKGWRNGTGRLNIADLDGDSLLNVSYVSGKFLYALDENLQPMAWSPLTVNEETSGHTGCTLFDFNGDGQSEIVYRDEKFIYIVNGVDGSIHNQQACVSRTNREYPIVADVDADGQTEICVTCGFDDQASEDNFCDLDYSRYSHVRVFKTGSDPWVPARRVWNQHGYFNVNINDDLTIPIKQQKHHKIFSEGSCTKGPNRPLNGFLNQSPFLNIDGCPSYRSPDLAFVQGSLTVNPPTCPNKDFTVSFQFTNVGDNGLSGNLPISFYSGNPMAANAIHLNTITISLNNFKVNAVHSVTNATVNGFGNPFTLYIVLNDNGTTGPPVQLPNTNFLECDYGNNVISAPVNPNPVTINALKLQDNIKCLGSTVADNGAARAFIPMGGGVENTTDYNFYWSLGNVAKPVPADRVGAVVNGLAEGVYTVYAIHKTANCSSNNATVTIGRASKTITVSIQEINPYTNCQNPNGQLKAIVNDLDGDGVGDPVGNFNFAWHEGVGINDPQVSITAVASGLKPLPTTYSVFVTDKASGCQTLETSGVQNQTTKPDVEASATNIICSSANSGSASAKVNNTTTGFTFEWSNGSFVKATPDFTGAVYGNRPAGSYTVVAKNNSTSCKSDPETVTVGQTTPVTVSVSGVNHQTSCDPSKPNGSAKALADGTTTGFTFEWFRGQNTSPGRRIATTPDVANLASGVYTVKATNSNTGCSDIEEVRINSAIVTPALVLGSVGDLTDCRTPNGTITVNVTLDSPSDYTFFWYKGNSVKQAPDFPDTDNVLSGLPIGDYTVRAVHNTKHCNAAPIRASIENNTPTIEITQDNNITLLPTNCNSTNGRMQVIVSAPGNASGFLIEWHKNSDTTSFFSETGVFSSTKDGLGSAVYNIDATNLDNGCMAEKAFNLPFAGAHLLELVDKTDPTKCNPDDDGSIMVKLTPTSTTIPGPPVVSFSVDDYDVNFYRGDSDQAPLIQSYPGASGTLNADNVTANYGLGGLTPGFYTVVAVENHPQLGNCKSLPVTVEIIKHNVAPLLTLAATPVNNTNCSGATGNGEISVEIRESTDAPGDPARDPADYTIVWSPNISTGAIAQNIEGGIYTVHAINNSTQCPSDTSGIEIFNTPPIVSITEDADLIVTDITLCSSPNGASATVISVDGVPLQSPPEFTYEWFDATLTPYPNATTPVTTNAIDDLGAGIYYVRATRITGNTGLNCASELVEFEVEDKTAGTVSFDLESFLNPTRCKQPQNDLGHLTVTSQPHFDYTWYNNATATGPVAGTGNTISNISIPSGTSETVFTVQVLNTNNDCVASATYTLTLDVVPVSVTASGSPVTSCLMDDGSVFGTITSGSSFSYNYNWYVGATVDTTPDYTPAKQVNNLPSGTYTLVAVDVADNFCQSTPFSVTIDDEKVFPIVSAAMEAPLTICDPARPDAVASAHVDNDIINYYFDWYENTVSGTPVFTGAEAGNLKGITYAVVARHIVSGCSDTTQVTIEENLLPIPMPQVVLLSNVTSCVVKNGALSANVEGNTSNYVFHWYLADPGAQPDTTSSSHKGDIYSDLDVGTYYVSATSRLTGCISGPANGSIIEAPVYPDFDFTIANASCKVFNMNEDGTPDTNGQPDGVVVLRLQNEVEIASIEWQVGQDIVYGPILSEVEAGTYSVTVTSTLGCPTTKPVEVKTEINPFNGISRNHDGKNDIFYINCIDNFPGNHVKIYNRAGTLVYEADGYNNFDVYFDGVSNKGLSVMGTDLPDGTYFYIIDKGDGSKSLAGYLEIVK